MKAFNTAFINGELVTPHGTTVVDLINPTNNEVIGKVTSITSNTDGTTSLSLGGLTLGTSVIDAIFNSASLPVATTAAAPPPPAS